LAKGHKFFVHFLDGVPFERNLSSRGETPGEQGRRLLNAALSDIQAPPIGIRVEVVKSGWDDPLLGLRPKIKHSKKWEVTVAGQRFLEFSSKQAAEACQKKLREKMDKAGIEADLREAVDLANQVNERASSLMEFSSLVMVEPLRRSLQKAS
jgi:hypothetical protein